MFLTRLRLNVIKVFICDNVKNSMTHKSSDNITLTRMTYNINKSETLKQERRTNKQ